MAQPKWDEALLKELSQTMVDASICGLGQAAPNPLLTAMKYFPHEFSGDKFEKVSVLRRRDLPHATQIHTVSNQFCVNSIRRFFALPSAVALSATGFASPYPAAVSASFATPLLNK